MCYSAVLESVETEATQNILNSRGNVHLQNCFKLSFKFISQLCPSFGLLFKNNVTDGYSTALSIKYKALLYMEYEW